MRDDRCRYDARPWRTRVTWKWAHWTGAASAEIEKTLRRPRRAGSGGFAPVRKLCSTVREDAPQRGETSIDSGSGTEPSSWTLVALFDPRHEGGSCVPQAVHPIGQRVRCKRVCPGVVESGPSARDSCEADRRSPTAGDVPSSANSSGRCSARLQGHNQTDFHLAALPSQGGGRRSKPAATRRHAPGIAGMSGDGPRQWRFNGQTGRRRNERRHRGGPRCRRSLSSRWELRRNTTQAPR